jgi:hypothetical protein
LSSSNKSKKNKIKDEKSSFIFMYHHNPNQTPRKNLRLENYDYSSKGFILSQFQYKINYAYFEKFLGAP